LVPNPVIKKGEESSPSSFVPLSAQVTIPQSCPLNTEVRNSFILKAETDHLSFDLLEPAQMASIQIEKTAYQMTKEKDVQSWNPSLDEDCSNKGLRAKNVSVSHAQEYNGASFILVVQTTIDTDEYRVFMVIQQMCKCSHEEHPRRKIQRGEVKVDPYLPVKLKFPNLFEVEDQINLVLLIYDQPNDRQQF